MCGRTMDKNLEIRKLPPRAVFQLAAVLDVGNAWQHVMANIPSDPTDINSPNKYTVEHIRLIETVGEKQNKSCSTILLDEWGTSGKVRATIDTLLKVLVKAELFRAAEYVAIDLLKDSAPARPPSGPAAAVTLQGLDPPLPPMEEMSGLDLGVADIPYAKLEAITGDFDDAPFQKCCDNLGRLYHTGHKLGTGAFGTVYYGEMPNGRKVAVKKLGMDIVNRVTQFQNEIEQLSKYQHKNLVCLLGFSCDTSQYCLVYEFMANGSLADRLKLEGKKASPGSQLTWRKRLLIAVETFEGINFLHTSRKEPLIHRDVKTANILLDDNLVPKLGDFGLVKVKPADGDSKLMTTTVFGTSAYMPPEAFRGDVSVKLDVFSMGVVILELLTGLASYDENREGCDLITFIEDSVDDSIEPFLDWAAGDWDVKLAEEVFQIARSCLEEKKKRPFAREALQRLTNLVNSVSTV